MSRMYIVNHWNDAAAYSGEQIGDRLKDSSALHFHRDGSANTELYSEEYALKKKKTSVPLADRVLPQQRRVRVLTEQLYELEAERKSGMDLVTYSQLRDVLICKRDRAEELLKKALSVKPINKDSDDIDSYEDTAQVQAVFCATNHVSTSQHTGTWVDDLPDSNSLKRPIKIVCTIVKGLISFTSATKRYIKTLQEV